MYALIIGCVISIFFSLLLQFIAAKRGTNTFFWTFMGAFLGPLAIPFVFFARTSSS